MSSDRRPNILVIMSDQHSKHVLGCYGNGIVRTPNLDRLAAAGMRFDNAYCPSPLCVPSRMSFMTSRSPTHNRTWNNSHSLPSGIPTWAHVLGAAGYETSLIGRMHFVGPDQRHGFENRPRGEMCARYPGTPVTGGPMWTRFPGSTSGQCRASVEIAGRGHTHYQWFDETCTDADVRYFEERAETPQDRPFAAVVGYVLPHCPFVALKELFDYYYPLIDIPPVETRQPDSVRRFREVRGILEPPLPEERIRVARAAYFGMVEHLDRLVGRVLDALERSGLADNTLVVYTTDHGEMAGDHGCWWKSNYYEGSVGIPLIARLPGTVAAGSNCGAVCNLTDLGPTFAEIAATQYSPPVDGRSLLGHIRSSPPGDWPDETFSELFDQRGSNVPSRMIRSGRWKLWWLVDEAGTPPALFDLEADPDELNDLGTDPAFADVRDCLLARLRDGWDPELVSREGRDATTSYRTLCAYGAAVNPASADAITVVSADYEADVELL